ncbi:MAG: fimbrillin family protein, partial [Muribaculaceae bacterium]|nr:fimbrillin family protein [Muribaculaceae bacterium]
MDAKLTYSIILSFAACLVSSCTSDAPAHEDVSKGSELTFDVSGLSRASITTSIDEFAVFGDMKFPVNDDTAPIIVFDGAEVGYVNDRWSYNGTQYWFPNHEHSFVAIHPLAVLSSANNPTYSNSRLYFTYNLPSSDSPLAKNDVKDIIAATHRRLYREADGNTTVTLKFSHLLSLINVAPALNDNIMTPDEFILIHKLELTGFNTGISIYIQPAQRQTNIQTDDREIYVIRQTGSGNMAIDFTEPVKIVNGQPNLNLFAADDASACPSPGAPHLRGRERAAGALFRAGAPQHVGQHRRSLCALDFALPDLGDVLSG